MKHKRDNAPQEVEKKKGQRTMTESIKTSGVKKSGNPMKELLNRY